MKLEVDHVVEGWRDTGVARALLDEIRALVAEAGWSTPRVVMEICGTHTMAVSRWGIRSLLPAELKLISGPGCPVCVTDDDEIDEMIALAFCPGVTVATFGDLLKVPGTWGTLGEARAKGAQVRVVSSPLDAVALAQAYSSAHGPSEDQAGAQAPGVRETAVRETAVRETAGGKAGGKEAAGVREAARVVFLAVGFETTAPATALALTRARNLGLDNFFIYPAHKLTPPAMRALLADREVRIDGFLIPGHVSTVLGDRAFAFLAEEYDCPAAVAGFEPVDILAALREIVRRLIEKERPTVVNTYRRAVRPEGNPRAVQLMHQVFSVVHARWRGLGEVPASGLALRPEWAGFDARRRLGEELARTKLVLARRAGEPGDAGGRAQASFARQKAACRCGDVLRGKLAPTHCPLFGRACTPARPVGPCMVSSEGACAAYYRYERAPAAR